MEEFITLAVFSRSVISEVFLKKALQKRKPDGKEEGRMMNIQGNLPRQIRRAMGTATLWLGSLGVAMMAMALGADVARADGFACTSVDQDTKIAVYFDEANKGNAGPRASRMVVTDPTVSVKRQLIAQFAAADGLLNNSGSVVIAYVDLNHPDSSRRGEHVGGTVLGALSSIVLDIDFTYEEPVEDGTELSAQVVYLKRNGEELTQDFDCVRYRDPSRMERDFVR